MFCWQTLKGEQIVSDEIFVVEPSASIKIVNQENLLNWTLHWLQKRLPQPACVETALAPTKKIVVQLNIYAVELHQQKQYSGSTEYLWQKSTSSLYFLF